MSHWLTSGSVEGPAIAQSNVSSQNSSYEISRLVEKKFLRIGAASFIWGLNILSLLY